MKLILEDNLLRINSMDFNKRAKEIIEQSIKVYDEIKINPEDMKNVIDQISDFSNLNKEVSEHINYHNQQDLDVNIIYLY
jgi:hypothetical protein